MGVEIIPSELGRLQRRRLQLLKLRWGFKLFQLQWRRMLILLIHKKQTARIMSQGRLFFCSPVDFFADH
ncbi:hypothetical protein MXD81_18900, partial [Microbacteriaceae bacterium K1510]|nr:hypothetical protein [Microbacteriaceae bacterium K1510]